jgi:hypothetical protein
MQEAGALLLLTNRYLYNSNKQEERRPGRAGEWTPVIYSLNEEGVWLVCFLKK